MRFLLVDLGRISHGFRNINLLMGTLKPHAAIWWLVHWPLMGGLLHLVQRGAAWMGCASPSPLIAVPNGTAHQLHIIRWALLYLPLPIKGLRRKRHNSQILSTVAHSTRSLRAIPCELPYEIWCPKNYSSCCTWNWKPHASWTVPECDGRTDGQTAAQSYMYLIRAITWLLLCCRV